MMDTAFTFIGNFHPVLVHLPIGFLLLGLVFQWLGRKEKYRELQPAVRIAFLLGMASAVLSCISGWFLSAGGEYDDTTLSLHKWMGITVAAVSLVAYLWADKPDSGLKKIISVLAFLLIIVTGHLGGTLTHGEGFLTKALGNNSADSTKSARKAIVNVQEALVYADIIQPVLQEKCAGCHSATKQKGGLRLDTKEWILKGGKDGQVFISGNPTGSELYKRVVMDPLEEKHMPPKGKSPLTEQEANLLHWWISSQAGFDKKVKELVQTPRIMPALLALQTTAVTVKKPAIPEGKTDAAPAAALDALRKAGVIVLPVAENSHYLLANFVSIQKVDATTIGLLKQVAPQLAWLKLGYAELLPESWKQIGACSSLTKLSIEHTNLTDETIIHLTGLQNLQYLNLVGTKVSAKGVALLKNMPKLESLYLGQTAIKAPGFAALQKQFPKTVLDSGNYHVENLAVDTQLLKPVPVKK